MLKTNRAAILLQVGQLFFSFSLVLLTSCGSAEFSGGSKKVNNGDAKKTPPPNDHSDLPTATDVMALSWNWECQGAQAGKQVNDKTIDLYGEGSYELEAKEVKDVVIKGELCRPEQMPRDIVFVVDVSGSMEIPSQGNDALNPQTRSCSRNDAVLSIMQKYANDNTEFAVITFSDRNHAVSASFAKTAADMIASTGNSDAVGVLCAAKGGTNYEDPLLSAREILKLGREDATKEIYFVSDGKPQTGLEGDDVAAQLKQDGILVGTTTIPVTIATVMVGSSNDAVLKQYIASKAADGSPLHAKIDQASLLSDTLAKMANNSIVAANISFRPSGTADWTVTDLMPLQQDFTFNLPPLALTAAGLDVKFSYTEARGRQYEKLGNIVLTSE